MHPHDHAPAPAPSPVTVREVAVLKLLDRRGAAAAGAVVTHAELARASGVSVRQVQRRLRRLRQAGLVVIEGRRGFMRPNRDSHPSVTA